jgi:hypothetical protein
MKTFLLVVICTLMGALVGAAIQASLDRNAQMSAAARAMQFKPYGQ